MQIVESTHNDQPLFYVMNNDHIVYTTLTLIDAEEFIENYISPSDWPEPPQESIE